MGYTLPRLSEGYLEVREAEWHLRKLLQVREVLHLSAEERVFQARETRKLILCRRRPLLLDIESLPACKIPIYTRRIGDLYLRKVLTLLLFGSYVTGTRTGLLHCREDPDANEHQDFLVLYLSELFQERRAVSEMRG